MMTSIPSCKSGAGAPHSMTWRSFGVGRRDSVLECGTPVPLWEGGTRLNLARYLTLGLRLAKEKRRGGAALHDLAVFWRVAAR